VNNRLKTLLFIPIPISLMFAAAGSAQEQTEESYATYIMAEEWMKVNELPGVDRQIVSRNIGKLNLSVGIIHRGAVEKGSAVVNPNPERPCGVTSTNRESGARGIMHFHQTETYIVVFGSGTLVTGGTILNGEGSDPVANVTTVLNGPSCSGMIVGDFVTKHVKEGDVVIMPAGTPHGWLEVPVHVDYMSVRPDPDRVLSDHYINPALGPDFKIRTEQ